MELFALFDLIFYLGYLLIKAEVTKKCATICHCSFSQSIEYDLKLTVFTILV